MNIESLVRSIIARGVLLEPLGDKLRVEPVEKLNPGELDTIRKYKPAILNLFRSGRLKLRNCLGDDCDEELVVVDGLSYCNRHQRTIRFVEERQ